MPSVAGVTLSDTDKNEDNVSRTGWLSELIRHFFAGFIRGTVCPDQWHGANDILSAKYIGDGQSPATLSDRRLTSVTSGHPMLHHVEPW